MDPVKVKAWLQGPRGGWYYVDEGGKKHWGKEALAAAKTERTPPPRTGADPLVLMQRAKATAPTAEKVQELMQRTLQNEGLTYDVVNQVYPATGFVVSTHPEHETVYPAKSITEDTIAKYIEEKLPAIEETEGAHLGIWYDKKTDNWVFDVSHVAETHEEAKEQAIEHGQFAYFDLEKCEEVRMDSDPRWLAKWGGKRKLE